MDSDKQFTFAISLNVLNHLGRHLYRSFTTVLGEAISNSWDADANNVWIYLDRRKNSFVVKDDGDGMSSDDFQNKFLKIGYSKRGDGGTNNKSAKGRPFIGRKGIGKLALLSCADRISVISKKSDTEYTGGLIDNSGLDEAIKNDLSAPEYKLPKYDFRDFKKYTRGHKKGTIIYFQNIKKGTRDSFKFLKKMMALYFRFSLLDKNFNIFVNDQKVTINDLTDLAKETEFLWTINSMDDPYISRKLNKVKRKADIKIDSKIRGFIASVTKPRYLKIINLEEKIGIDLFVNGRLREANILHSIPSDRLAADYLYGQIHFDSLDDNEDRFTTAREGVIPNDAKYKKFLELIKPHLSHIYEEWDTWRVNNKKPGDQENPTIPRKERASKELYNAVSEEYGGGKDSKSKAKVEGWIDELRKDAEFNFESYAECFIAENLVRKHIEEKNIKLSPEAQEDINKYKTKEKAAREVGNVSIPIRRNPKDTNYLDMDGLANLVDKAAPKTAGLSRDANEYKPIRDAVMHTALLTDEAKKRLSAVFENIKGRVKTLLD